MESRKGRTKMKDGFTCERCGKCCLEFGDTLYLEKDEVIKWRHYRGFIRSNFGYYRPVRFMDPFYDNPPRRILASCADLFFHPVTREELFSCPFLRKVEGKKIYQCLLHDTGLKPRVCVEYPHGRPCLRQEQVGGIPPAE